VPTSRQQHGHIEVYEMAMELGLTDQDLIVLMPPNPPVVQFKNQKHTRKNWVFNPALR
jgi:hypothetical protein